MKRDTKALLLEKGLTLMLEKGFHNTGIQEALKAADVPKGSFYHFFENKEDFGRQVLERYSEEGGEQAAAVLADPAAPPLERLRTFFSAGCQQSAESGYRGGCLLGNLTQELADQNPEFAEILERKWREIQTMLANVISEAQTSGDVHSADDPHQLAGFLINSWQGAVMRAKLTKCGEPQEQFTRFVFNRILA